VYAGENEAGHDKVNGQRYSLLGQQLSIYKKDQISWSIWLYKDIGFQGMYAWYGTSILRCIHTIPTLSWPGAWAAWSLLVYGGRLHPSFFMDG
jgi:hypothetical protein